MGILSAQQLLSDKQAVTTTTLSTNVLDLKASGTPVSGGGLANGPIPSDMGRGTPIDFLIQVTDGVTAAGGASVTFTIEVSDNENMSSSKVVYSSGAVPKASLVAGYKTPVQVLPHQTDKRYLAVRYTVSSGPLTAGSFTAGITMGNANGW